MNVLVQTVNKMGLPKKKKEKKERRDSHRWAQSQPLLGDTFIKHTTIKEQHDHKEMERNCWKWGFLHYPCRGYKTRAS
jgi:hypothetical protein